jgi:2-dehydro-3-deoxygluconokinase
MRHTVVQCVGECMLEISREPGGGAALAYAGDAYNTAVYLSRVAGQLGAEVDVRFLTGVGEDNESDLMRASWRDEGVGDDAITMNGARPGAYLIATDENGERSFTYWRSVSASAQLFPRTEWVTHLRADWIYLSGITLQLMSSQSRGALGARLDELRRGGTRIAFDSNFRLTGWASASEAREAMATVLSVTDLALVTLDDELALRACRDLLTCIDRLAGLGVAEAVVKVGAQGAWVHDGQGLTHVPTTAVVATDTTAAGDSFNGAYLAARVAGMPPAEAARLGNLVAGQVVTQRGAIIASNLMPMLSPSTPSLASGAPCGPAARSTPTTAGAASA